MDSQQCMWFSRLSFGVSIAALVSTCVGGCQKASPDVGPEQVEATSEVSAVTERSERSRELAVENGPEGAASDGTEAVAQKPEQVAKAKPEPAPEPSERAEASEPLQLRRLVVTQKIDDREPVLVDSVVLGASPVIAFLDLKNPDDNAQTVVITFEKEGSNAKVGFVELEIPARAKRWRTWGNTQRIDEPGKWVAVVSTKGGEELGRQAFEVEPTPSPTTNDEKPSLGDDAPQG